MEFPSDMKTIYYRFYFQPRYITGHVVVGGTFLYASLSLVLLWQLFYLFCSSIVINTVIVTAGYFEP